MPALGPVRTLHRSSLTPSRAAPRPQHARPPAPPLEGRARRGRRGRWRARGGHCRGRIPACEHAGAGGGRPRPGRGRFRLKLGPGREQEGALPEAAALALGARGVPRAACSW